MDIRHTKPQSSESDHYQVVPATYRGKVDGNRKQTHVVLFKLAPSVVSFVLKDPIKDFFMEQLVGRSLQGPDESGHPATNV